MDVKFQEVEEGVGDRSDGAVDVCRGGGFF